MISATLPIPDSVQEHIRISSLHHEPGISVVNLEFYKGTFDNPASSHGHTAASRIGSCVPLPGHP